MIFIFQNLNSAGSAYVTNLFIDGSAERVGIGTTSPSSRLHISEETSTTASATGTTLLTLTNDVGADLNQQKTFVDFTLLDDNSNETPQVRIGAEVGQNGDANSQEKEGSGAFVVYTNNADTTSGDAGASLAERMRVDYQGNVGIGTSSPDTYNVQLASGYKIGVDTSSGGTTRIAEIEFYNTGDGSLRLKTDNSSTGGIEFHTEGSKRVEIDKSGDVLPGADGTQDLGSSSKRWGVIYSADLDLSNEGSQNDVDGTWGSYVIQEGEEDLFLINRRNGKKYKFMLQEVQD